jgi:DNA-directed RNA polymerase subunit K/omega
MSIQKFKNDIEEIIDDEIIIDDDEEIDEEEIDDDEIILENNDEIILSDTDTDEDNIILNDLEEYINEIEDEEKTEEEKIKEKRTSFNILTKYEKNFILGFRTQQIINGSVILIDINQLKKKNAYEIAKEELRQRRIPFKIKRHFPNGKVEIWDIEELIFLD